MTTEHVTRFLFAILASFVFGALQLLGIILAAFGELAKKCGAGLAKWADDCLEPALDFLNPMRRAPLEPRPFMKPALEELDLPANCRCVLPASRGAGTDRFACRDCDFNTTDPQAAIAHESAEIHAMRKMISVDELHVPIEGPIDVDAAAAAMRRTLRRMSETSEIPRLEPPPGSNIPPELADLPIEDPRLQLWIRAQIRKRETATLGKLGGKVGNRRPSPSRSLLDIPPEQRDEWLEAIARDRKRADS